jgi:hypothetical protein
MAVNQLFIGNINTRSTTISTSNTMLDGTGPMAELFVAGPSGSRVDKILIKALASTSSGVISIFMSDGSDIRLVTQSTVDPVLPSTISTTFESVITTSDIFSIPAGWSLLVSTTKNEYFTVTAFGWDY